MNKFMSLQKPFQSLFHLFSNAYVWDCIHGQIAKAEAIDSTNGVPLNSISLIGAGIHRALHLELAAATVN